MTLYRDLDAGVSGSKRSEKQRERRSSHQRMSPYYFLTSASHSSHDSSHSPPIPTVHNIYHAPPNFYYPPPDYPVAPNAMWHRHVYNEDELPNMSSNMAAAMYPRIQVGPNPQLPGSSRRYSVTSAPPGNHVQPPQRRKISVTKYQNIPPGNYLQVPSFHDYDLKTKYLPSSHHLDVPSGFEYVEYSSQTTPPSNSRRSSAPRSRKTSGGCIPKTSSHYRQSRSVSRDESRSRSQSLERVSPPDEAQQRMSRSTSLERVVTPDPDAMLPVPAFEFTSSHLPLRPPTININKFSSGSGSTSTPESQRIESRQMIRPSTSKIPYSPKVEVRRENKKDNGSIWSITKPAKWCRHAEGKSCPSCNNKDEITSQCSSVNPPPTFTALDNYQPIRKRSRCSCSCGAIFSITIMLAVLVMLFIAAFIVYVEMVLKHQTANVMDKM